MTNSAEIFARYEWFRRRDWDVPARVDLNPLFARLLRERGAAACAYVDGVLGREALDLAQHHPEFSVIAHLHSPFAVEHARELAHNENSTCVVVGGDRSQLSAAFPHPLSAMVGADWMAETDWAVLKSHFAAAAAALAPGGFLAFPAPKKNASWHPLLTWYDSWAEDEVLWTCRDGAEMCVCVRSKLLRADNFADVKYQYIYTHNQTAQIETVVKRLPAYWTWQNVADLARQTGFGAVESIDLPDTAPEYVFSALAILTKNGGAAPAVSRSHLAAYADF